jgi:hypothetical protein
MAVITTGSAPKALIPAMAGVTEQAPAHEPLSEVAERFVPKPRKPPKIKKRAFGNKEPGAAFRK